MTYVCRPLTVAYVWDNPGKKVYIERLRSKDLGFHTDIINMVLTFMCWTVLYT